MASPYPGVSTTVKRSFTPRSSISTVEASIWTVLSIFSKIEKKPKTHFDCYYAYQLLQKPLQERAPEEKMQAEVYCNLHDIKYFKEKAKLASQSSPLYFCK